MKLDATALATIAALSEGTYHPAGDPPYVALVAGRGDVQLDAEGYGYYLTWDQTLAVDEVIDLGVPETTSLIILADWLAQKSDEYKDH